MVRPLNPERIYFPGLDTLRFVAAASVLVQHVVQFQLLFGYGSAGWFHRLFLTSRDGVLLFFVLSGFLITYLLLVELERDGSIDIRRFYVRRVLRIWPLYFLLLVIAFAIYVAAGSGIPGWLQPAHARVFLLYVFFLANVALFRTPPLGVSQTWSIAVEEQFYVIWPPLLRVFRARILAFIVCFATVKILVGVVLFAVLGTSSYVAIFVQELALESMAIGALGAVLVHRRSRVLQVVFSLPGRLVTLALFVAVVASFDRLFEWTPSLATTLVSLAFLLVILNVGCNERVRLGNGPLDYLGRISYGIYMFHPLVVYGFFLTAHELDLRRSAVLIAAAYVVSFTGTIAVAACSYRWFETPFLRLKKRFAHVPSGGDTLSVSGFAGSPTAAPSLR
ncbi:MAG: acyltransferase family protein [Gaiellaceae bacterium]